MKGARRAIPFVAVFSIILLFIIVYNSNIRTSSWRDLSKNVGMGEWSERLLGGENQGEEEFSPITHPKPEFRPGKTKPPGEGYSKALVVPKTKGEDISWMDEEIPDIDKFIYVADDPTAPLHPPKNKGHEVMIYLTYLIDFYDELHDVTLFMHSHQRAWHNNDILGGDAGEMIRRLSPDRVTREGYMNLKCNWGPGCPNWMHPGEPREDGNKMEEVMIAKVWAELFPLDEIPGVVAQPCCSQFALSRERIRAIPKSQYMFYRNWLLNTPLKDFVSGRVWEYLWQFVFTGESSVCPLEHVCYCDGYGVCFGGPEQFDAWYKVRGKRDDCNNKLLEWEKLGKAIEKAIDEGRVAEAAELERPEEGKDAEFKEQIETLQAEMDMRTQVALKRGENPRNRAIEAGRPWKEGDGF